MSATEHVQTHRFSRIGLTRVDAIFLVFLGLVVIAVCWVGRIAYMEGKKTEISKQNGEAWITWFSKADTERFAPGYEPAACAGAATDSTAAAPGMAPQNSANTWAACLEVLTRGEGALAAVRNPFFEAPPVFAAKCDTANRTLTGALVLEKILPTPPGSAVTTVTSQLIGSDPIGQKFQIRVTVCDKGVYPVRVGETDF